MTQQPDPSVLSFILEDHICRESERPITFLDFDNNNHHLLLFLLLQPHTYPPLEHFNLLSNNDSNHEDDIMTRSMKYKRSPNGCGVCRSVLF